MSVLFISPFVSCNQTVCTKINLRPLYKTFPSFSISSHETNIERIVDFKSIGPDKLWLISSVFD